MAFVKITPMIVFLLMTVFGHCQEHSKKAVMPQKLAYRITPANIKNVKLTDEFWLPIIKKVQEKTIEYAIQKCEEEGRMVNFLIAGKQKEGTVKVMDIAELIANAQDL